MLQDSHNPFIDEEAEDKAARLLNASDLTMAASFNEVALPPGFETVNKRKLMGADYFGDFSFTTGGGRITEINGIRFDANGRKIDEDGGDEDLDQAAEMLDRKMKREEWSRETHSYFGADLTGKQWGELADHMRTDTALRKEMVERMMKDGKSREEAEKKYDEMADVYDILRRPPSQWTPEEREKVEAAKTDPDFQTYTQPLANRAVLTVHKDLEKDATTTSRATSIATRSDLVNADFPSAPSATEHHREAVAATEPLDARKPQPQVAAAVTSAPAPAAAAGFDV